MKNLKFYLTCIALTSLFSCQSTVEMVEGNWRATLIPDTTRPELELPFNMEFQLDRTQQWTATIKNANEKILIDEIIETEDSVTFYLPVFEGFIKTAKTPEGLTGSYTHKAAGGSWSAPILLEPGIDKRFNLPDQKELFNPTGRWQVTINPGGSNPETQVGEFILDGQKLTGTFLTVIGDYRFLEGSVSGDQFKLSCFDGAHSLLFSARLTEEGTIEDGVFTGGPRWKGTWRAERNEEIKLPDATSLTYLKPGYSEIEFSFPDTNIKPVSLDDDRFKGKVKIVQIIGSWCPNCMDETRFFAELYQRYQSEGLEIIALCYESDNLSNSLNAIKRFKSGTGANYTFLYAGVSNKKLASQTLPMLNRIISYPTSIFIDRDGNIQKIFTGFSGPGTGAHFQKLSSEMVSLIEEML